MLVAGALLAGVVGLTACGGSGSTTTVTGKSVMGSGMATTSPPWPAQYRDIKRRLASIALPRIGNETFHRHQLLHIYSDGILVPVAANIGVKESQDARTALRHVLAKNDNIVIAYGAMRGVPLVPDATALGAANGKGEAPVACSVGAGGKKPRSCFAKKQP